ncbi:MAG TPA: Dyp-type peroxidase [Candidatus Baltobacteraceae bacterium]|nr:Dyp-type peroxidase [Candidatus Baltobacteraceae bacterium]
MSNGNLSRRSLLASAAAVGSVIGLGRPATALATSGSDTVNTEPFYGPHQSGILTEQQRHTYFAAFDVIATNRADLVTLLQTWTTAAARLTSGQLVSPESGGGYDASAQIPDSGETIGLGPARLTLTFGFGPELFIKGGQDRFNLSARRPEALVTLPTFVGDKMIPSKTGGELSVQACADDPQVAFHAVRQLARLGSGAAQLRWVQSGFLSPPDAHGTPRNLMGFKDGTETVTDPNRYVWAGNEAPRWMQGGSYVVARRIRIVLEHWDKMKLSFQEQTIGRQKLSGAPIGMKNEFDALPLDATDEDGNPVIAENAHVRLADPSTNNGAEILRRGYSYNDGIDFTTERWPPWRQGMEYDAGLLFVCYQRDPRTAFISIFDKMSKIDMLNQFTTHTGGGIFACPRGVKPGEYIGQDLFA